MTHEGGSAPAAGEMLTDLPGPAVDAATVEDAVRRLRGIADVTPLQRNERLSEQFDLDVWLKREDLQPVRSYKLRGAYNLIAQLPAEQRAAGVVCASAGNHARA